MRVRFVVGAATVVVLAGCTTGTIEATPTEPPAVAAPANQAPTDPGPPVETTRSADPASDSEYRFGAAASVTITSYDEAGNEIATTATVTVGKPEQRTEEYLEEIGPQQVLYVPVTIKAVTKFDASSLSFSYTAPDGLTVAGASPLYESLYPGQVVRDEVQVAHEDGTPLVPRGYVQVEGFLNEGRVVWK
jgi:hypothetical protein